jgi:short-subunit dehydrogenase
MKLQEMRVVLTGATGGIGRAIARELAASGASLLLVGRNSERLADLERELRMNGADVAHVAADIARYEGIAGVVNAARNMAGGPANVLINNAGVNEFGLFAAQKAVDIAAIMTTNVVAPMLLTQAFLPLLQKQDAAIVMNVGSILGSIGLPGQVAYSASKFGLHGFSESLRRETLGTSVNVLYVAPRATNTEMNSAAMRDFNQATGTASDEPGDVARRVVEALGAGRRERFIGWPERLFVKLNALLPSLVDRSMRKPAQLLNDSGADSDPLTVPDGVNP